MFAVLTGWIERISGPWLYVVAAIMTFAETGTLLFFVPGEFTLILAGIAAGAGNLNLAVMIVVACAAAVAGDACGFYLGDRFGESLKRTWLGRKLGEENWSKAQRMVREHPGRVVLFGRWIGFLRAVMPAASGMSDMNYKREFLRWDVPGACSWAAVCVVAGYKLGHNAEKLVKYIGFAAIGAVLLGLVYYFAKKRLTKRIS